MTERVIIAGGGIGGLTAALSLHSIGIEAVVLESARDIRALGVGINLLPHAVRELTRLGLGDALARTGVATTEIVYCDHGGKRLFAEPRGLAGGYGWPQYSIHRGRLQLLLLDAVRERGIAVRTGVRVEDFEQDDDSVRAAGLEADLLVGADGVQSAIRARLHPGRDPLLWSGVRMWRGVTSPTSSRRTPGSAEPLLRKPDSRDCGRAGNERHHAGAGPFRTGRSMIIARNGLDEFIAYPIGDGMINWVALRSVAEPGELPGDANWNAIGHARDLLPHFAWHLGWLDVAALIERCDRIFEYPMVDRDPLPSWGVGRVTLLGDAAHPMYPVGANGASQAIVDAAVLAGTLGSGGTVAAYEKERIEATAAVVAANREMQRTGHARSAAELTGITGTYRRATRLATKDR